MVRPYPPLSVADRITRGIATWRFIILFNVGIAVWAVGNAAYGTKALDPFPFVFLNLMLSWLAGVQAPLIMISQRRQDELQEIFNQKQAATLQGVLLVLEAQHQELQKLIECQEDGDE